MTGLPAYEIWLTDDFGKRLAARNGNTLLDNIFTLRCTRVVNGIGWCRLVVPRAFDPTLIRPDYMIQVWRQPRGGTLGLWRIYFLRKWRFQTVGNERFIQLEGPGLNDLLRRRIVAYYAGSAQSKKADIAADDMLKEVATESIADGTNPAPAAGTRVWGNLSIAPDTSDGPVITKSFPWSFLLTPNGGGALPLISKAARAAGTEVFFDVVPDVISSSSVSLQFRTYTGQRGADRTVSGTLFSDEQGNLEDPFLEFDHSQEQNYIYGGGQGQGAARNIQQVSDSDRYNQSQWNRCEGFADARNATTDDGVRESARAQMEEGRPRKRIGGTPLDVEGSRFGVDWEFGDRVRARYENEEFDAIIRTAVLEVNEDGEETVQTNRLESEA